MPLPFYIDNQYLHYQTQKHLSFFIPDLNPSFRMDFLNKGKDLLNKAGSSSGGQPQDPNAQQAQGGSAGQEDYGDKGKLLSLE